MNQTTPIYFISIMLLTSILSCQLKPNDSIKIKKVNDDVIVFEYLDVNSTAIRTDEGIIIIDTQRSPGIMRKIKKIIEEEFDSDDFKYVINTHCHWDHCSGNQVFNNATIVGHENCGPCMINNPVNSVFNLAGIKHRISKLENELDDNVLDHKGGG